MSETTSPQQPETNATSENGMIVPTQSDFIFALDGCGLNRESFTVDFDTLKWRNTVKAFKLVDEKPLAFYLIFHFVSGESVLFTDKGVHLSKGKEILRYAYSDIRTVNDTLQLGLADGRAIQLPQLPRSNQKLAGLLRSLHEPKTYAALRPQVQQSVKKYTPFSGMSMIVGIISAVILWNVLGGFHGFIIGYILGHIIAAVVAKAMAPERNPETGTTITERQGPDDKE